MGRLIDEDPIYVMGYNRGFKNAIKASIPKTDYENRLRADMVAMLKELKEEIEEKAIELCDDGWWLTYNNLIQQKIDTLKENTDDKK